MAPPAPPDPEPRRDDTATLVIRLRTPADSIRGDKRQKLPVSIEVVELPGQRVRIDWERAAPPKYQVSGGTTETSDQLDRSSIYVLADWTTGQDASLMITATVTWPVLSSADADAVMQTASASHTLTVLGAKPEVRLELSQGTIDADGSSRVLVVPRATLFGEEYRGGIAIAEWKLDDRFLEKDQLTRTPWEYRTVELWRADEYSEYNWLENKGVERLHVRALFRLDDDAMQELAGGETEIALKVTLSDRTLAEHLTLTSEAKKLRLRPSDVVFTGPTPVNLPDPGAREVDNLKTRITAAVQSASGKAVPAADMLRRGQDLERFSSRWWFDFEFGVSTVDWLARRYPHGGSFTRYVDHIDNDGIVHFVDGEGKPQPYCEYDHRHFQKTLDGRISLKGQGCRVDAKLRSEPGVRHRTLSFYIGVIEPRMFDLKVHVRAMSDEALEGATVFAGAISATTDARGLAMLRGLPEQDAAHLVKAVWKTKTRLLEGTWAGEAFSDHEGTTVEESRELRIRDDGQHVEVRLPVSTRWSLSTSYGASVESIKVYGVPTTVLLTGCQLARDDIPRNPWQLVFIGTGPGVGGAKLKVMSKALSQLVPKKGVLRDFALAWWAIAKTKSGMKVPRVGFSDPFADATPFRTKHPVHHNDFQGPGWMDFADASVGVGYTKNYAHFSYIDHHEGIDVSSISALSFGVSAGIVAGYYFEFGKS